MLIKFTYLNGQVTHLGSHSTELFADTNEITNTGCLYLEGQPMRSKSALWLRNRF